MRSQEARGYSASLELMWGMESRLGGTKPYRVTRFIRPHGFIVIEGRPRLEGEPSRILYLVRHVGVDTRRAGLRVARALDAREFEYAGLKDAMAVVYQYYTFNTSKRKTLTLEGGRIKAWPLGPSPPLRPGRHTGNKFILYLETSDPSGLCRDLEATRWIPGYYGPQRFGVLRPNTHYMGMLLGENRLGSLIAEYKYRYPLEELREEPGYYERTFIERAIGSRTPWERHSAWPVRFALQALQAYLFNRALSIALREDIRAYAEHWGVIECFDRAFKVPMARLPAPGIRAKSRWAKLVWSIAEEEGLNWMLMRGGPGLRRAFRPLLYPVCSKIVCKVVEDKVKTMIALPRGAYVTVAIWQNTVVDWSSLEYSTPDDGLA